MVPCELIRGHALCNAPVPVSCLYTEGSPQLFVGNDPLYPFIANLTITLSTEFICPVLHPHQQFLCGGSADASMLKFANVGALATYLHAHPFDLDTEELKFHLTACLTEKNKIRTLGATVKIERGPAQCPSTIPRRYQGVIGRHFKRS